MIKFQILTVAVLSFGTLASGVFAQSAKAEPKKPDASETTGKAPTLEELEGHWVLDLDKLADTAHYRKHPESLKSAKKWSAYESYEFSKSKATMTYGEKRDLVMTMDIKSHKEGKYQDRPAIVMNVDLSKSDGYRAPDLYNMYVIRREDGALEVYNPRDILPRPLKRKAEKK
jgi:hypothetical protein